MSHLYPVSILWLRRDLRLNDHAVLAEACAKSDRVIPVFVFDTNILDRLDNPSDRRLSFIHASLVELKNALRLLGSDLAVLHGDPKSLIPEFAGRIGSAAVFAGKDYEPYAKERDLHVARSLERDGRIFHAVKDQVIFESLEVITGGGTAFRVFTPYSKAWLNRFDAISTGSASPAAEQRADLSRLAPAAVFPADSDLPSLSDLGFVESPLWLEAGESAAQRRLKDFLPLMSCYADDRDFPSVGGTSGLSVHLRFGTISIRELVRRAMRDTSKGARVWLNELIWREFYHMILDQFPHVANGPFRREYDHLLWPGREDHFLAWCEGRTGYPIVDAAMRHFNATGWMHNRLRMVVAMFLTKDLLLDWRWGEAYFARHLLDFDLAANNGGWQWSASTGVDAAPYFRVFNPVLQSRRFDPDGTFIREQLPELRGFSDKLIHWPHDADMFMQQKAGCIIGEHYPHPIVNHATQKVKAIAMFRGGDS
ncbi:MAG: DNA photolyase family protein [Bacteroidia bacterium]|nr:DNA photolyase family protein [Bacteroidia bacterium]